MPEIEKLYSVVKDNGLYTKSYDEFVGKYSDEKNMSKLYQVVYDQGLYTKSFDDFKGKYFTQVKKKRIGISFSTKSASYFIGYWSDGPRWGAGAFCKKKI